jgi:ribosomal protein S18 acetylase RimI-like enzyme
VTRLRPFRNLDPPSLARLWNRAVPKSAAVCPLRVHELDSHALGSVVFEADGLIVAEKDGRIVGFVHAGFGPALPIDPAAPLELCHELGAVAMLVIDPDLDEPELAGRLITAGEDYLRSRGARVLYAGGVFPLNPFYWGVSGGSEGAGVLSGHQAFHQALIAKGYAPAATTALLEVDLRVSDLRDPRSAVIRRQTQVEYSEDALPGNWWQSLALGEFQLMNARLLAKPDSVEIARALTWDMSWFGRTDHQTRIGLLDVHVAPEHRRKGYGRFLVGEILRRARENMITRAAVSTSSENQAALGLYASLGFQLIDEAMLYRLPALLEGQPSPA